MVVSSVYLRLLIFLPAKASILWHFAFFMVQLSKPHIITGETIALAIWTSTDRVLFLLFNTLSKFVIAFLPRRNCLLISWLQSPSAVFLESKKRKSVCRDVMGPDAMIIDFLIFSFKPALSLSSFAFIKRPFSSTLIQFSSVTQSCLTLCNPMNFSTPDFPVHHQQPELAQTHVLRVSDAIKASHSLPAPSPPAFNLSQY